MPQSSDTHHACGPVSKYTVVSSGSANAQRWSVQECAAPMWPWGAAILGTTSDCIETSDTERELRSVCSRPGPHLFAYAGVCQIPNTVPYVKSHDAVAHG